MTWFSKNNIFVVTQNSIFVLFCLVPNAAKGNFRAPGRFHVDTPDTYKSDI